MKISGFITLIFGIWSFIISSASAAPISALPTNRPSERAVIFSTTHRYAVSGCPAGQGLQIANWAEDVEARLSRFLGLTIPSGNPLPLQIRLGDDPALGRGRIIRSQGLDAGMLNQKLDMINPRRVDQEDLLEGLCSLLLTRAMVAHLPSTIHMTEPPRAPDWLAVGAAQNLFPEARQRNMRSVMEAWKKGGGHSIREMTGWEFMPEGRWDDKFEAGIFVQYLMPPSVAARRTAVLLARIESGDAITTDFLAQRIFYSGTIAAAEKARDLWLAQQQDVQTGLGGISPDRVAALVQMLEIRPVDYGFSESADVPLLADMKDLIRRRREKWVLKLAPRVSMKMQALAIGQAPEFQRVVAGYVGFLDALARGDRGFFGTPSDSSLQKVLSQADAQFIKFQAAQKQRDNFLERTEEKQTGSPDASVRRYLDGIEKKSGPASP